MHASSSYVDTIYQFLMTGLHIEYMNIALLHVLIQCESSNVPLILFLTSDLSLILNEKFILIFVSWYLNFIIADWSHIDK